MSENYDIMTILNEMDKFVPETGFNLCSIDEFEAPGEKLALIAHFDTIEEAQKEQEKYGKDKTVIYSAKKKS